MTASTPASRRRDQLVGVVDRPHVHLRRPVVGAGDERRRRRSSSSVHTSGWTAVCPCAPAVASASSGGTPNDSEAGRHVGAPPRAPGRRSRGRTTTPARRRPARPRRAASRATTAVDGPGVGVLDLDVHQRSRGRRRAPRPASARRAAPSDGRRRVSPPSGPTGVSASWRTTSGRRRCACTSSSTPSAPRARPPPPWPERCSPARAGWRPGARARASRSPCHAPLPETARNSWSAPCAARRAKLVSGSERLEVRPGDARIRTYGVSHRTGEQAWH